VGAVSFAGTAAINEDFIFPADQTNEIAAALKRVCRAVQNIAGNVILWR
jgi:hypothetical protein